MRIIENVHNAMTAYFLSKHSICCQPELTLDRPGTTDCPCLYGTGMELCTNKSGPKWNAPLIMHTRSTFPWSYTLLQKKHNFSEPISPGDPDPGSCTFCQSSSIYTLPKKKRNFPCCVFLKKSVLLLCQKPLTERSVLFLSLHLFCSSKNTFEKDLPKHKNKKKKNPPVQPDEKFSSLVIPSCFGSQWYVCVCACMHSCIC